MTIFEYISKTFTLGYKGRWLRLFYIYGFIAVIGVLLPIIGLFVIVIYSYIASKFTSPSPFFMTPFLVTVWWWFVIEAPKRRRENEERKKSTSSI